MLVKSFSSRKVLVAVSGGPDSMALLHMLESQYQVVVLHVNYQMRQEAKQETRQLLTYCQQRGLVYEYLYAPLFTTGNFQDQARKFRYWFAQEMARKHQADSLFVGHHNDDHLKTYLMWRERFLLFYGLRVISQYGVLYIHRPLLHYSKAQLLKYCQKHQVPFVLDSSNAESKYARNRVVLYEGERERLNEEVIYKNAFNSDLRLTPLQKFTEKAWFWEQSLELQFAYLMRMLGECGIYRVSFKHLANIRKFLLSDHLKYRIGDYFLINQYGFFYLFQEYQYSYVIENVEELKRSQIPYLVFSDTPTTKVLQLRWEDFPLVIRNFLPGDELKLAYGTKKVNRLFIDRKVRYCDRFACPLVINCQGKIIYLGEIGMVNSIEDSNFQFYMV